MRNPKVHFDASVITTNISSCQKQSPNSYVSILTEIPSPLALRTLKVKNSIYIFWILQAQLKSTIYAEWTQITIKKCSTWTRIAFQLIQHTKINLYERFFLLFWLLKFSTSSTAITSINTSNKYFLDLLGDSLWYEHCICHAMPVH
jgi:hypothetical protein